MTNDELAKILNEQLKVLKITARMSVVTAKLLLEIHQDNLKDKLWHKIDNMVTELDKEI